MSSKPLFTTRPLYLQVRDTLIERISSGEWKPGTALPNEIDLSRELGVSVGTVRRSLNEMELAHLVSRKQGRGTYVNDPNSDDFALRFDNLRDSMGGQLEGVSLDVDLSSGAAAGAEVDRLELRSGEPVIRASRLWSRRGRAYMTERVALPEELFPELKERKVFPDRIVPLARERGMLAGRAVENVTPKEAPADIAASLQIAKGSCVLALDRVIYSIDGRPLEWRIAHCTMQNMVYVVEML